MSKNLCLDIVPTLADVSGMDTHGTPSNITDGNTSSYYGKDSPPGVVSGGSFSAEVVFPCPIIVYEVKLLFRVLGGGPSGGNTNRAFQLYYNGGYHTVFSTDGYGDSGVTWQTDDTGWRKVTKAKSYVSGMGFGTPERPLGTGGAYNYEMQVWGVKAGGFFNVV